MAPTANQANLPSIKQSKLWPRWHSYDGGTITIVKATAVLVLLLPCWLLWQHLNTKYSLGVLVKAYTVQQRDIIDEVASHDKTVPGTLLG